MTERMIVIKTSAVVATVFFPLIEASLPQIQAQEKPAAVPNDRAPQPLIWVSTGGIPLIVDDIIIGAVGSAGHRGDGNVLAVKPASHGRSFAKANVSSSVQSRIISS